MRAREMTVCNGEVCLATEKRGEPINGTILMVMGATASMAWWPESLLNRLAEGGYQVIRFDHRDTGRSTTNPPGEVAYDLEDLASDLFAVLDSYEVDQAHLVGLSLGGFLAQINALRHPDRTLSLTLIASEPFGIDYQAQGISEVFMAHFGTMGTLDWSKWTEFAAFLHKIAELSSSSRGPFDAQAARHRISQELARSTNMRSAFNHSMIAGAIDLQRTAADLRQPVLLIHGSDDPIISVNAAHKSAEVISDAKLVILAGVGHEQLTQDMPLVSDHILAHCLRARASQVP